MTNAFRDLSDSAWLDVLSGDRRPSSLPSLPPDEIQRNFTGRAGRDTFAEAVSFYRCVLEAVASAGLKIGSGVRIVDLGCGWGRISQTALRDFAPENIYSVDIMPQAIEICRATGLPTNLVLADREPPTQLPSEFADIVMAYSVFSHLREDAHWAWLREVRRLLRAGSIAVLTTRDRAIFDYAASVRRAGDVPIHARGMQTAFGDIDETKYRYDAGEYIFDIPQSTGPLQEIYGEAVIPCQYVEREWTKIFTHVEYRNARQAGTNQAIIVCRA
jgi:SAM-dependent methyltransferase